jgi:hypothetical protein
MQTTPPPTPRSPFRGLGCFTYRIDGALYFFMGTATTAAALAHATAVELGATRVEVLS